MILNLGDTVTPEQLKEIFNVQIRVMENLAAVCEELNRKVSVLEARVNFLSSEQCK